MLYPSNIEEKLGFHRIKEYLKDHCEGELGVRNVETLRFSTNFDQVEQLTSQTDEFLKILNSADSFPGGEYYNINKYLAKAAKIDAYLLEEEFHEMKLSLTKVEQMLKFLKKNSEQYSNLSLITIGIYLNPQIVYAIENVIDERGKMRNTASDLLLEIRNELHKLEFKVRNKLENILKNLIKDNYSNDDATVTIRNGRLVVPVRAEFKRAVSGFIHDESASGQTSFIEPSQVVEINNDIRDLIYKEKREIVRILMGLTDLIRPEISNLKKCNEFLGLIDFIRAKARFARDLEAVKPELSNKPVIDWHNARHPLLYLSHKKLNKEIVPLDIRLASDVRILVISGPNAGGKSVCLQTVGLLQYMWQCGLLVPLSEGSVMGIFSQLFIDIGDEQSLENDLSTYSSHLINMKIFINKATPRTLFLIDEFGAGTEPQFGGAIAESILDELRKQKVMGIITTHYTNLKKFAENHPNIANGAMRFDIKNMEPLFVLDMGKPGSSFALEIARKIGLPDNILNQAKKFVGATHVRFERLITELEQEKREFEKQKREVEKKENELKKLISEYESLKDYIESQQDKLVREAGQKASELIRQANREIEKTIRTIKEKKADREVTRKTRQSLEHFHNRLKKEIDTKKPEKKARPVDHETGPDKGPIREQDYVKVKDSGAYGIVMNMRGNQAEIAIGDLKSNVKLSRLEKVPREEYKNNVIGKSGSSPAKGSVDLSDKRKTFSPTIDLRGMRAEEALNILNSYLDDALLLNMKDLRIMHGKGEGILRKVIREFLNEVDYVDSFKEEHVEHGGAGVTLVELK